MDTPLGEVTLILHQYKQGDQEARDRLISLVYSELRRIAKAQMRNERADHSLQPTALVNEAYLRLVNITRVDWHDRIHFFSVASSLMRRVLVEHARANRAQKRGGREDTRWLDENTVPGPDKGTDVSALDDALNLLAKFDERKARIVEMRFFAGMTEEEIAGVLEVSDRTVKREWRVAKAWLFKELKK